MTMLIPIRPPLVLVLAVQEKNRTFEDEDGDSIGEDVVVQRTDSDEKSFSEISKSQSSQ